MIPDTTEENKPRTEVTSTHNLNLPTTPTDYIEGEDVTRTNFVSFMIYVLDRYPYSLQPNDSNDQIVHLVEAVTDEEVRSFIREIVSAVTSTNGFSRNYDKIPYNEIALRKVFSFFLPEERKKMRVHYLKNNGEFNHFKHGVDDNELFFPAQFIKEFLQRVDSALNPQLFRTKRNLPLGVISPTHSPVLLDE